MTCNQGPEQHFIHFVNFLLGSATEVLKVIMCKVMDDNVFRSKGVRNGRRSSGKSGH